MLCQFTSVSSIMIHFTIPLDLCHCNNLCNHDSIYCEVNYCDIFRKVLWLKIALMVWGDGSLVPVAKDLGSVWTPPLQLTTVSSGAIHFAGTCIQVEHINSCRLTNIHIFENKLSKKFFVTVCLWVSIWMSELFFAVLWKMLLKLWYRLNWICWLCLVV